jgi:hypothetical protein
MTGKKIFIPIHEANAGKWIYQGFYNGWRILQYDVQYYKPQDISELPKNSYIMAVDSKEYDFNILSKFDKVFLYCRNNFLPGIYSTHPNFVCDLPAETIQFINDRKNFIKFNFGRILPQYMNIWQNVHYLPLAFDHLSYNHIKGDFICDVGFVGGFADNGFNTKIQIMKQKLAPFQGSKLKCKFYIGKNISHEDENKLLCGSRICLNIHDQYQTELGLDTNERTFKALGLSGVVISDHVECLKMTPFEDLKIIYRILPEVCEEILKKKNLQQLREHNKNEIRKKHLYVHRAEELLSWM